MSNVRRRPCAAPRSSHAVAGPGRHLDFAVATLGLEARLGSGDVATYSHPIEKKATAGELASVGAVGTHKAFHDRPTGRRGGLFLTRSSTGSAGHDCHCDRQEECWPQRHHCIACHWTLQNIFTREVHLIWQYVPLYNGTFVVQPGDRQKLN